MRIVMMGLVSILLGTACGKKADPGPQPVDAAPAAAAPDTAVAAAPDAAPAAAADTAPAVAADTAPAAAPDAAPAAGDAGDVAAATGDAAPAGDAGDATTAGAREPTPPPKPFDDLTVEEQKDHMKKVVMPVMRPRFQAFDAEEFAKFTCATCHGPGAKEGKFELPNAELTKLPSTPEGWKELEAKEGPALKFMKEEVVPAMAIMIGEPPYDPATNKGFGCFECHTKQ